MRTVSGAKLANVGEMEEKGESVFERSEFRFASEVSRTFAFCVGLRGASFAPLSK